jgi:hypothetical protein
MVSNSQKPKEDTTYYVVYIFLCVITSHDFALTKAEVWHKVSDIMRLKLLK